MSTHVRRRAQGFTVIELIVVIIVVIAAGLLFFFQKNSLQTASTDERRKTAINAIYYDLEEVYHPKNGYYPSELNEKNLNAVDPALLTDQNGTKIDAKYSSTTTDDAALDGAKLSEYIYEPTNCDNEGKCKSYTLRVALNNEGEYIKKSRNN